MHIDNLSGRQRVKFSNFSRFTRWVATTSLDAVIQPQSSQETIQHTSKLCSTSGLNCCCCCNSSPAASRVAMTTGITGVEPTALAGFGYNQQSTIDSSTEHRQTHVLMGHKDNRDIILQQSCANIRNFESNQIVNYYSIWSETDRTIRYFRILYFFY